MASKLRLSCEYFGAKFGLALIRFLPPRAACWAARRVGSIAYATIAKRRRIAIDNLLKTGVCTSLPEARRIARLSFQSIALAVVESLVVPKLYDDHKLPPDAIEIIMPEETRALLTDETKTGIITVSAHFGNWELGAKIASTFRPITGIARRMNNARVQDLMERANIREGFETIDKHESNPLKIVRVLKRGRVLAMLTDQHAHGDNTCTIDFFGLPAKTYSSPAFLQHLTHCPILLCVVVRTGILKFRVEYSSPLFFSYEKSSLEEDVRTATQEIASRLESKIRERPEQYLWAHNRWHEPRR